VKKTRQGEKLAAVPVKESCALPRPILVGASVDQIRRLPNKLNAEDVLPPGGSTTTVAPGFTLS